MASTPDMAPNRSTPPRSRANGQRSAAARTAAASRRASTREEDLSAEIRQLQNDIKAIASTVAGLAEEKVDDARSAAKREARNIARTGQQAIDDMQDEFGQLERQLKDTIRDKPLTAVAGAIALGFILAVVTR